MRINHVLRGKWAFLGGGGGATCGVVHVSGRKDGLTCGGL